MATDRERLVAFQIEYKALCEKHGMLVCANKDGDTVVVDRQYRPGWFEMEMRLMDTTDAVDHAEAE